MAAKSLRSKAIDIDLEVALKLTEDTLAAATSVELLERSLAILERHYGPEHVDVAKTRRGLGKTHLVLGDVAAARSQLERAIEFYEAKFGADHRDTCRCCETLASLS